jgi:mannose/fructose-specific phosphotransferase system component IIA
LVCGFNLPSLIKFFTYKDKIPLEELLREVIASGKEGIREI